MPPRSPAVSGIATYIWTPLVDIIYSLVLPAESAQGIHFRASLFMVVLPPALFTKRRANISDSSTSLTDKYRDFDSVNVQSKTGTLENERREEGKNRSMKL